MKMPVSSWLILLIPLFAGCRSSQESAPPRSPGDSAVNVLKHDRIVLPAGSPRLRQIRLASVELKELPLDELTAPGKVEANPNRISRVLTPVGGRIKTVLVVLGDTVVEGQPLLTIESPEAGTALVGYMQAQAQLRQSKSALVKAEKDLSRVRALYEYRAAALKEVLSAENELSQAQSVVEQTQAAAEGALHRLGMLGLSPENHTHDVYVRAPIRGKILEIAVAPGEYRNDSSSSLMIIADLSTVWVTSQVPESAIRLIQQGERIDIELAAYPGEVFHGHVKRIADTVDPQTRTVKVQTELDNQNGRLRPEMFGKIRHSHGSKTVPVQKPIFFSLLILISAYIPLFALERVEGRLFSPMAFTICAALVGSLLFSLTLVPILATYLFPKGFRAWKNPMVAWLTRQYERALRLLLGHQWKVMAATGAIVVGTVLLGGTLGTEFLPQLDEGVIWIRAILPPGISLEKSAEVAGRIRSIIRESPEVRLVTSQTGRQESNTEPFGPNRNELLLVLTPYSTWPQGKSKGDLVKELSERLTTRIPGATFSFTQPIIDMVMEAVTGSSADLAVILSGPDLEVLRGTANQVFDILREIQGAADTAIEQEADQPQLRIQIDRREAARYGINIADVQEVVELAIGGKPVSAMFEGDRRFDVVVRYIAEARSSLAGIGNILVPTVDGGRIPLSRLAEIKVADGSSIIARRENRRQISIRTNIRGRDQGSFVAEAQKRFETQVKLPQDCQVEWGGQFENLERARRRLAWILPITIVIIFALLYWSFGSALNAGLILANVPFSVVGGVAALYLRRIPFSLSAAVGFVSLFGVAVMAGILYVSEIHLQRRDYDRPLKEAVLVGACVQFRPLLILILVAMLGMVPAAFARGIGSDIQRPLATVVVGGLVSTLLLTLLVLPCLYYLAERGRQWADGT